MKDSFTLSEIIEGKIKLPSTKVVPLETSNQEKRNGSMPQYLYFAVAAMVLRGMGKQKMDPSLHIKEHKNYSRLIASDFQSEIKKRLFKEAEQAQHIIDQQKSVQKGDFSKLIQARLLHWVTSSTREFTPDDYLMREKDSINAGKDIPMLTIPSALMIPLTFFLGTDKNARVYVIQVAKELHKKTENNSDEKRTWSRTVHNKIMYDLIEWHRTPEEILRNIPSLNHTPIPNSLLK